MLSRDHYVSQYYHVSKTGRKDMQGKKVDSRPRPQNNQRIGLRTSRQGITGCPSKFQVECLNSTACKGILLDITYL